MAAWFTSTDGAGPDAYLSVEFEAFIRTIDGDPGWRAWWSRSAYTRLVVAPAPVEMPADRPIVTEQRDRYVLVQPSAGFAAWGHRSLDAATGPGLITRLAQDTVLLGLDNVGKLLGLGPGPGRDQAYAQSPTPRPQSWADVQHAAAPRNRVHDHRHEHRHDGAAGGPARVDEPEVPLLRPAHPDFVAHFRHQIYDADDFRNDDRMPFGTDEGSDTVSEWNDHADELTADTTLRQLLGDDPDGFARSSDRDDSDALIAAGFSLLRFTGRIDPEGAQWLLTALKRQGHRLGGPDYRRMRKDLQSFLAKH